ncbi:MAG: PAS domain S-box protein [Tenericutes bacterium]|nr:PAS domain S-box protein [Mycoplasmatota bacterium]
MSIYFLNITIEIISDLAQNIILLFALVFIYAAMSINPNSLKIRLKILVGTIIGGFTILLMLNPWEINTGLIFDARSVLLGVSGLFFGPVATFIAAMIALLYRVSLGGAGVYAGVATILFTSLIGVFWYKIRKLLPKMLPFVEYYVFGIVLHIVTLSCFLLIPWPLAFDVIRNTAFTYLGIFPIVTMILGLSLYNQRIRLNSNLMIISKQLLLNTTLLSIGDGVIATNKFGEITIINNTAEQLTGFSKDEAIGKKVEDVFSIYNEVTGLPSENIVEKVMNTGIIHELANHTILRSKDGKERPIADSAAPIVLSDGTISGAVLVFRDYTEKYQAEKNLVAEKELAQNYLDIAGVMLIVLNTQGEITLINQKGCHIIGLSEDEIVGKNWFDNFIPKEIQKSVKQVFDDVFKKKIKLATHYENSILNAQGEERFISWDNTLLYDADNNIIGILASGEDITDRKLHEEELIKSESNLKLTQSIAKIGSWEFYVESNQVWGSDEAYNIYELDRKSENVEFSEAQQLISAEDKKIQTQALEDLIKDNKPYDITFRILTKKGNHKYINSKANLVFDQDNKPFKVIGVIHDITEIKVANNKLQESERRYKELNNNLDTGVVVHNPDTSINYCNKKAEALLGFSYDELLGSYASSNQFVFVTNDYKELELADYPVNIIIKNNAPIKNYVIGIKHIQDKKLVWVSVNGVPIFNDDGSIQEIVISFNDITLEKERLDEIMHISNHDYLTDLYNRRYFTESYNKMDNPKYYPLGVLMLDVNGLKIINDAYGHGVGDIALKKVSDMLQNSCRKDDIICRIGGDEFAVILPNVSQDELESIKTNIQEASTINKVNNIELSLATGYEIKDKDIEGDLEDILTLAENHMYRHKLAENVSVRNNAIKAILKTLTEKYEEERIHSAKVSQLCKEMGEVLDLSVENVKELEMAGMYHDIGKISIPDAILNKPGKLTDEEYVIIKTHPEISYQILRAADEYSDLAIHALHHHERWDGKGYPNGLKGEKIPLFSRIICIADAYEAMTAARSYKKLMSQDEAVKEIIKCSGSQFDEKMARVFVEKVLHKEWKS